MNPRAPSMPASPELHPKLGRGHRQSAARQRYRHRVRNSPARYDEVAEFYALGQPDAYDADKDLALFDLVGPLQGEHVIDVACGHGRIARELARRSAHVVGVDISAALIERARRAEQAEPLGIDYIESDVASTELLTGETFDIAVSNFGLSDIDDLSGALTTVSRLLRAGGTFVFAILHPCFPGRGPSASAWAPGSGYDSEGWWVTDGQRSTLRQNVGANHRMLSTYLNALINYGFTIEAVAEPQPPEQWHDSTPGLEAVPTILVIRSRKSEARTSGTAAG